MRNLINHWQCWLVPAIAIGLGTFIMVVMVDAVNKF